MTTHEAPPDCDRWRAEIQHVHHADADEIKKREKDHRRYCPVCNHWTVPPWLPRDPTQEDRW